MAQGQEDGIASEDYAGFLVGEACQVRILYLVAAAELILVPVQSAVSRPSGTRAARMLADPVNSEVQTRESSSKK